MKTKKICFGLFFLILSAQLSAEENSSEVAATPASAANETETRPSWTTTAQEIMLNAISLTGIKYQYGGTSPETGFDCSGFVRYVFQQAANLTLPHGARALSQIGQSVSVDKLQPGDLVFFNTLKSTFSHVGIYIGNNRFIHSPSAGSSVSIVDMSDSYWIKRFNGARRITSANTNKNITPKDLSQPTPAE